MTMKATATRSGNLRQAIRIRDFNLTIDEPADKGGEDTGPSPQEMLAASLAACTAITMEMYAKRKNWDVGDVEVAALGPPRERDLALAGVDRDDDPDVVVGQHPPQEHRVAQGGGPDHDPFGSRPQHREDGLLVAQASSDLNREGDGVGDAADRLEVAGLPRFGAVEVYDVQEARPFVDPAQRRVDRIGVVGRLARVVALQQPHRLAAADVDGRVEDHVSRPRPGP